MGICQANKKIPQTAFIRPRIKSESEMIVEDFYRNVSLIDISNSISAGLRRQLNGIVMLRSAMLLEQKSKFKLDDLLNIQDRINPLKNDCEFEHYYPIISEQLYDISDRIAQEIKHQVYKSTGRCSINSEKHIQL